MLTPTICYFYFFVPVQMHILKFTTIDLEAINCISEASNKHLFKDTRYIVFQKNINGDIVSEIAKRMNVPIFLLTSKYSIVLRRQTADILAVYSKSNQSFWDLPVLRKIVGGRTLIFVTSRNQTLAKDVRDRHLWNNLRNVNVTVGIKTPQSIEFYVDCPFLAGACINEKHPILINEYINGSFSKKVDNLFPCVIPKNLGGCPLIGTWADIFPYIIDTYGYEYKIIELLAETFNFTIQYKEPEDKGNFWIVHTPDGNLTNTMLDLKMGKVDFAIGGLAVIYDRYKVCQPLYSHAQVSLIWVGPGSSKVSPIAKIKGRFTIQFWVALVILDLIVAAIYLIIRKKYKPKSAYGLAVIHVLSMQFQQLSPERPLTFSHRFITITCIIFFIHISAFYSSGILYNLMFEEYYEEYPTTSSMVKANLECYTSSISHYAYKKYAEFLKKSGNCSLIRNVTAMLYRIAHDRSAYLLYLSKATTHHLDIDKSLHDQKTGHQLIKIFPEKFQVWNLAIFMPNGHPLVPSFQRKILQIVEAGFFELWEIDLNHRETQITLKNHVYPEEDDDEDDNPHNLNLERLMGAFVVWATALCISVIVFICEIANHWIQYRTKANKSFWINQTK